MGLGGSYKTPRWSLIKGFKCPNPGQHQNCISRKSPANAIIIGATIVNSPPP